MEVTIKIITPSVPNFVSVDVSGTFVARPLSEFNDFELDQIAKEWRFALYDNRERQRRDKKP